MIDKIFVCTDYALPLNKGIGCDKQTLMGVVCRRNQQQRSNIRHMYGKKYEEDLIKRLQSKLHGNFQNAVALWMCDPAERDAVVIKNGLNSWTNKGLCAVVEIIYARTPLEMDAIRRAYRVMYKCSVEQQIGLKSSGDEKKLLLALVREDRPAIIEPDMESAKTDAEGLLKAISSRPIDKSSIVKTISIRSPIQLKATLDYYKKENRHSFGKLVKQEINGNFSALLGVAMKYAKSRINYFAKTLYKSMKGLGTDDATLVRILVMRAEIDMQEIKTQFYKKYRRTLESMMISDTSGSYASFLLFLVGATQDEIQAVGKIKHLFTSWR
ncbi:hypothetical protein KP509_03G054700 [Ceratopteris richardii]|uniref:Annexin n=1 Tax=Ceratopteris richardii TaxID=49495 RepID=A0A8T2V053_CERRI|nr:hypothetical protein KP509_03G054700 [Ceratopteris richardii]